MVAEGACDYTVAKHQRKACNILTTWPHKAYVTIWL